MKRRAGREKLDNQRPSLIVTVNFTKPEVCVREQARTHRHAVTEASQIGNSFSQFRFNDHRGNVNDSDVAGAALYSARLRLCAPRWDQEGRGQKTE